MNTSQPKVNFSELIKRPVCFLGLGFGSGLAPKAPGTFGTIAAIPIYLLVQNLSLMLYIILTVIAFIVGIRICQQSADWLQKEDPSAVVWDEIVGYLVTMTAAPQGWQWIVLGFVLFRIFDILKPWPISLADQKLHGGFGIMLDDVIAGIFASVLLQCIYYLG
ncbi:MAG: phosphatidylglycerophosphatase A [Piscirickettsiaceae bacterium]|jgi:phosphatidylglycerophosphatase A|nr:phosphatidylglycerophosphatase A [Piscirickettsiaceae bacterium]